MPYPEGSPEIKPYWTPDQGPYMAEQAELTITHRCLLKPRCPGCSDEASSGKERRELHPKAWLPIIKDIHEQYKVNFFLFMGGEPTYWRGFEQLTRHVADSPDYDGGFYTAGVELLEKSGTQPKSLLKRLINEGKIDQLYLLASVDWLEEGKRPNRDDASKFKAWHGLRLMRYLRDRFPDTALAIHQVIKPENIDQMFPLYKKAQELGVWYSCCPFVWRQYVERPEADDPVPLEQFQGLILKETHKVKLERNIKELISREVERLRAGLPRSIAISRAFLEQIPTNGIDQDYNCAAGRPRMFDVHTDGLVRWCVARDTVWQGKQCPGCSFVCLDRVDRYESLASISPDQVSWRNLIRSRKAPGYKLNWYNSLP